MNKRQKKKFMKKYNKKKYRCSKLMEPLVLILSEMTDDDIIKRLENMSEEYNQQLMAKDEYNRHIAIKENDNE